MNRGFDHRNGMYRCGRAMCIQNARIENLTKTPGDDLTGRMTVSYTSSKPRGVQSIEKLVLNITRATAIVTQSGRPVCFCDLRPGMWIDAQFSKAMTRSIPPQANAYKIEIRQLGKPDQPRPPRPDSAPELPQRSVTTSIVVSVDPRRGRLTTGIPFNINRQTVFNISGETKIVDRSGRRIKLSDITPGKLVRVVHATFQTLSIPPQSPAYEIMLL